MNGYQMTIEAAMAAGNVGMMRAAQAAGPAFAELADEFLIAFAVQADRPFSSEEVVAAAAAAGIARDESRAWGPVFLRAARAGIIRRSSEVYRRACGHGSVGLKWEVCR